MLNSGIVKSAKARYAGRVVGMLSCFGLLAGCGPAATSNQPAGSPVPNQLAVGGDVSTTLVGSLESCVDDTEGSHAIKVEVQGKSSEGQFFDLTATDLTSGALLSADLFLGTAAQATEYNDGAFTSGYSDQQLTISPKQAIFSGAKLSSSSGSKVTVTGTVVCS
jgi:hypothetical protein